MTRPSSGISDAFDHCIVDPGPSSTEPPARISPPFIFATVRLIPRFMPDITGQSQLTLAQRIQPETNQTSNHTGKDQPGIMRPEPQLGHFFRRRRGVRLGARRRGGVQGIGAFWILRCACVSCMGRLCGVSVRKRRVGMRGRFR